jgi:hypothetical protein
MPACRCLDCRIGASWALCSCGESSRLCIESETPYRFHEDDKTSIELLGSYLAIAIQHMQMQERAEAAAAANVAEPAVPKTLTASPLPGRAVREVVFYSADECILVDGEYLIRSLPARIQSCSARTRDAQVRNLNSARQVAAAAGVEGQPRDTAAAAATTARREVPRHPAGAAGAGPLRPRAGSCRVKAENLNTS